MANSSATVQALPAPSVVASQRRTWRVRTARRAQRFLIAVAELPRPLRSICYPLCQLLVQGFIVGLLRPTDVDQFVTDGYSTSVSFYDPRQYELPHDKKMLPVLRRLAKGTRLLDAFCGQGREAELLVEAGFQVVGVDMLAEMIDGATRYAKERSFDAEFVCSDFESFAVDESFDVVYTSCWMYSTFQGRPRRLQFLEKCRELCCDDGIIVASYDHRTASTLIRFARHAVARMTALITNGNHRCEPGQRIASSGLFWHCHDEATVREDIRESSLQIVEVLHSAADQPTFVFLAPQESERVAVTS